VYQDRELVTGASNLAAQNFAELAIVTLLAKYQPGASLASLSQGDHNNAEWFWQDSHDAPVQAAWNNYFAAFGTRDMDRILQDYTENSVIRMYDQTAGHQMVYAGLEGVRECFNGLFARMSNTNDLVAPVQDVHEAGNGHSGNAFVIWRSPASGYAEATDTFIFDSDGKVLRQNMVVVDTQADSSLYPQDREFPSGSGPVHAAWGNHFHAYSGQNVEQVLADYNEESVLTYYNQVTGEKLVLEGLSGVRTYYERRWASGCKSSDSSAPILHVEEGDAAQVFLAWRSPSTGHETGSDSVIFTTEGKILRQNIVVHYSPVECAEAR